jgi:anthranilate synthase component 1
VERAKELIAAGDFMQVQVGPAASRSATPSRRCRCTGRCARSTPAPTCTSTTSAAPPAATSTWSARRRRSWCGQEQTPAGQKITIRPLAGTRPRGATPEIDKAVDRSWSNDPKERAEHVMLIDLARNDIGRIAKTGTVKVSEAFAVERYSHVMHIVSNVEGILKDGMSNMDVLKAPSRPAP